MPDPIIVITAGGSGGLYEAPSNYVPTNNPTNNDAPGGGAQQPPKLPMTISGGTQIVGFVPLIESTSSECRDFLNDCCYSHYVYSGDISSFLMEFPLGSSCTIYLQQYNGSAWSTVATLNSTTYGTFYNFGATPFTGANYIGYKISWSSVYSYWGAGTFRISFDATVFNVNKIWYSERFCLDAYSCKKADRTVVFSATMSGKIGSCDDVNKTFDLYDSDWVDAIRMKGIFGFRSSEQEQVVIKYETGLKSLVRDEKIPKYIFKSGRLPATLHKRFETYGLMADTLTVTDYNYVNADYGISTKKIILDGGYAPDWKMPKSRLARVTVTFKEAVENLIKSHC